MTDYRLVFLALLAFVLVFVGVHFVRWAHCIPLPPRRALRWPRVLWRGFVAPTFSVFEAVCILALLGSVHVAVVDQLSYLALVCAERFTQ